MLCSSTFTYGETGPLFSVVGEPFAADPSLELIDMRDGDELDGFGGASAGRFLGLGLRVGCGEDKGAAADATAVDIIVSHGGDQDARAPKISTVGMSESTTKVIKRVQNYKREKWTQCKRGVGLGPEHTHAHTRGRGRGRESQETRCSRGRKRKGSKYWVR